jgi:hypothetical protein
MPRVRFRPIADISLVIEKGSMSYSRDTLDAAHKHSSRHREEIERSNLCGCFYCGKSYAPADIKDWTDEGDTALCPSCGIDSVIGSASPYPVTERPFLQAMHARWF